MPNLKSLTRTLPLICCFFGLNLLGVPIEYCSQTLPSGSEYIVPASSAVQDDEFLEYCQATSARSMLNAMRAWNFPLLMDVLKQARHEGALPDWILEYQENCMRSCDKNGILLIHGLMDAMGFYYLQLIGSFRRDMSIVPVNLLKDPWYLSLMESNDPLHLNPPDPGMTREEIRRITSMDTSLEIAADRMSDPGEMITQISDCFSIPGRLRPVYLNVIRQLVFYNIHNRPIYILEESTDDMYASRQTHFIKNSLVYQVTVNAVPEKEKINWSAFERVLLEPKYFDKIHNPDLVTSNSVKKIRKRYADLAYQLLEFRSQGQQDNPVEVKSLLLEGPLLHAIVPEYQKWDELPDSATQNKH